jgi:hypothetical protein
LGGKSLVLRRLRGIFGGPDRSTSEPSPLYGLEEEERARIGTEEDPLRNFEAAMQRNEEAELAVKDGDTERAIRLYEISIREEFVGSHPYERLASVYESRHNPAEALQSSPPAERCPAEPNAPPTVSSPSSKPASNATGARSTQSDKLRSPNHASRSKKPPIAGIKRR